MKIKTALSLLMTMVMLLSFGGGALAEETRTLDSTLFDAMELSIDTWMGSDTARAYFAAIAVVELAVDTEAPDTDNISSIVPYSLAYGQAYIASSEKNGMVSVLFFGESSSLIMAYLPGSKAAFWSYLDQMDTPSAAMAALKSEGSFDTYYTLNSENVIEALKKIQEIISE